eukprot:TRINITY_DN32961_c0_g1_i1.p1 TRINITY_DN32961_c0_g1~~TRINITY_DN32961_c0_g1_i1.p1  ORF type:complete len:216 (+),score=10.68 TRINITY_DN32961_c0_g1_i1:403-1050(+)
MKERKPVATPIWKLLIDPHIACCAGALVVANICLAFLEPTISKWMNETMDAEEWQQGLIWLPAFFPHVAGVVLTVQMAKNYPEWQWFLAMIGLALEGISCFFLPFSANYFVLMLPICVICFGIALIDTALLPTLGFIVDKSIQVFMDPCMPSQIYPTVLHTPLVQLWPGGLWKTWGFVVLNIIVVLYKPWPSRPIYLLPKGHAHVTTSIEEYEES